MALQNSGSIAVWIHQIIEDIPATISGAVLSIVERNIQRVENYTGDTIGTSSIKERYQPAITDLSCAQVLSAMEMQGADVSSIKLGDFSVSKGSKTSTASARDYLKEQGEAELKDLKKGIKFARTYT